jgi:hypothetical protein
MATSVSPCSGDDDKIKKKEDAYAKRLTRRDGRGLHSFTFELNLSRV